MSGHGTGGRRVHVLGALVPHNSSPSSGIGGEMEGLAMFSSWASIPLAVHVDSPLAVFSLPFLAAVPQAGSEKIITRGLW